MVRSVVQLKQMLVDTECCDVIVLHSHIINVHSHSTVIMSLAIWWLEIWNIANISYYVSKSCWHGSRRNPIHSAFRWCNVTMEHGRGFVLYVSKLWSDALQHRTHGIHNNSKWPKIFIQKSNTRPFKSSVYDNVRVSLTFKSWITVRTIQLKISSMSHSNVSYMNNSNTHMLVWEGRTTG